MTQRPLGRRAVLVTVMVPVALAAGALAAVSWLLALAFCAAVLVLVVGWRRPELVLVLVAMGVPSGTIYPPLRIPVGPAYLTVLQVTAFALAALMLLDRQAALAGVRQPLFAFGAAFSLAGGVAALGSDDVLGALSQVVTVGLLLMALSVALARRVEDNQRTVHRTVVYAGVAVAALACYEAVTVHALLDELYRDTVRTYTAGGAGFRPVATIGNPLVASSAFVGVFALALTSDHIRWRYPCLIVLGAAIGLSLSRSSLALLAGVVLAYVLTGGGRSDATRKRRALVAAVAVPSAYLGAITVLPRLAARLQGRSVGQDTVRRSNAADAFAQWQDHWLTGLGLGGFRRFAESGGTSYVATVDNQYLTLLAELGTVGLLILLCACLQARRRRQPNRSWLPLAAMLAAGLVFELLQHEVAVLLLAIFALDSLWRRGSEVRQLSLPHSDGEAESRTTAGLREAGARVSARGGQRAPDRTPAWP